MKKVGRKQTACNKILAKWEKQNLWTNLHEWKTRPEPAEVFSPMGGSSSVFHSWVTVRLKARSRAELVALPEHRPGAAQLPVGSHLQGCNTGAPNERAELAAEQQGLCKPSVPFSQGPLHPPV